MGGEIHSLGGWAKYVRELADYMVSRGYHVKILCRMGHMYTDQPVTDDAKFKNSNSDSSNLYFRIQHLPNPLTVFFGIAKLVKEFKIEGNCRKVLHVHDISSSILIGLVVAKIFKSPLVIQIHGFPLREQCIKLRSPSSISKLIMLLTKIWHSFIAKIIQIGSILVLVNNHEVKSFYEALGINSDNLRVIPSAVDLRKQDKNLLSSSDAITYLGIKGSKRDLVIGYIGRLGPEKNLETLVKAFGELAKSFPEIKAKLIIVGDGYMRPVLEKAVKEYEIDKHTCFLGSIPDAYRFLNAISIFVLPSLSEGSPFSIIEAMVAGKAIIASDIPSIREIVRHDEEAILVSPYNVEKLKQAILLLYKNPDLRAKLGHRAREKAKLYDVDVVYGKILKVYVELARQKSKNTLS